MEILEKRNEVHFTSIDFEIHMQVSNQNNTQVNNGFLTGYKIIYTHLWY